MGGRTFDAAVLGAGPAGMMAALRLAEHGKVALVAERLPGRDDPSRVDAVPGSLMALLVELGVGPRAVGAHRFYDRRHLAWSTPTPAIVRVAPSLHLERPLLECALLERVLGHPHVALFLSKVWNQGDGMFFGDGWRARRLVDATGRASATAASIIRPARPWAARSVWWQGWTDGREPGFALTSLPEGYAYRIATEGRVMLGFVGRGTAVEGAPRELVEQLHAIGAGWMIEDLPPLTSCEEGRASTASVQWAALPSPSEDGPRALRVGESALARDPLSGQGIAHAASEALFVAAIRNARDADLFERRQWEQWRKHLDGMKRMAETCAFSSSPTWREYGAFAARHLVTERETPSVALRQGTIVAR
jgi:flavin-dependent dehydrogenase